MIKRKLSFKWFGSLGNLSFRRKSDTSKEGSHKDDEPTIYEDDMRPRCPSYARSSEMYTHMGTMPRSSKKKDKSTKNKSQDNQRSLKTKTKASSSSLGRSQSMRCTDYVIESPLMSALNGKALSSLHENNVDDKHTPEHHSAQSRKESETPTTEQIQKDQKKACSRDPDRPPDAFQEKPDLPRKSSLTVKMSVDLQENKTSTVTERHHEKEEEERKTGPDPQSQKETTDSQGEYVEFSKEKYLLESPPEKLRKELEEELKLSSSDLRSHGWYHGHIPREVSETLVLRSGDFLVRDSLANVGDYVVTCRWQQEVVHCRIGKVVVKGAQTKVQFLLEDETFDSLPTLIRHHAGTGRPVCLRSGAQLLFPINRTLPLRYLEATFALASGRSGSNSPSAQRGAHIKRRSVTMTDGLTAEKIIPHSDGESSEASVSRVSDTKVKTAQGCSCPSTVHHKDAMRNCALSMDQIQEMRCPLSPVGETHLSPAYTSMSRHRHGSGGRVLAVIPPSPAMRRSSEPHLSPTSSNNNIPCTDTPPSAPGYPSDGSEGGGSYCELRPGQPPTPPSKSYVERLRVEEGRAPGSAPNSGGESFTLPLVESSSCFRPGRYQSELLPTENKPLEMGVLKRVKELLAEVDPKTAAKHITKADCTVARILGVTKEMQRMMGVGSGLELLTLPHGHQLRLDLLERFYTMSIMMAVDLLGCTGSTEERASLLYKTIQLAAELKSTMGNMFGFAAIMRALELPQISRLDQTWMTLRQRHTEGAILYEKKLKPFMKGLNEGKESSVLSSTSFPHVVPVLCLLEKGVAIGEGPEPWDTSECGVDVVMSHLEAARSIAHHGGLYRTNAESKLHDFQERDEVSEIFCTEFQMRLLWGSRGSEGSQSERYEKFDKVLTALSHKLEPPVRHSEL
ncbi:SH2 domain-containing protein 3C isoform X1 [Silurus meridionalis]|uniref:SH2 domain-containing protein 3C isoform X1 n=1 Tax=Silurus meridionalis TaxID=175797 RepID=UPI001EEAE5DC|nr:SH2 domain-containing protein 3C isoform X1 [Silurus meridionalis]